MSARVVNGTTIWASLDECEVRSQIRQYGNEASRLLLDLTPFLSMALDGADIVVTLNVPGSMTRTLPQGNGYFDMIISDVGTTDSRAITLHSGIADITPAVTSAA